MGSYLLAPFQRGLVWPGAGWDADCWWLMQGGNNRGGRVFLLLLLFDMVREKLERSFQICLCNNCFAQRLLCHVSIRVDIPILGSHSGFSGFCTRLAALETEICVCSQAEWLNSPPGHPCASASLSFSPLAQVTLLLHCSLSFCGS